MFSALLIPLSMIFLDINKIRGFQFRPLSKISFYYFIAIFLGLLVLGAKHVESPYIELGQLFTFSYFSYFLIVIPCISYIENNSIMNSIKLK
jgi:ubiquinol-cytochrome c reductase cytochrome b subunit